MAGMWVTRPPVRLRGDTCLSARIVYLRRYKVTSKRNFPATSNMDYPQVPWLEHGPINLSDISTVNQAL